MNNVNTLQLHDLIEEIEYPGTVEDVLNNRKDFKEYLAHSYFQIYKDDGNTAFMYIGQDIDPEDMLTCTGMHFLGYVIDDIIDREESLLPSYLVSNETYNITLQDIFHYIKRHDISTINLKNGEVHSVLSENISLQISINNLDMYVIMIYGDSPLPFIDKDLEFVGENAQLRVYEKNGKGETRQYFMSIPTASTMHQIIPVIRDMNKKFRINMIGNILLEIADIVAHDPLSNTDKQLLDSFNETNGSSSKGMG